jgi:hypothetical protein
VGHECLTVPSNGRLAGNVSPTATSFAGNYTVRMLSPAQAIEAYILAKDGNRPHLLDASFTDGATLRMQVQTDAIAFPPECHGRSAIAETLVRRFNQTYENIYTLCIGVPPERTATAFSSKWLVAMSERETGAVRIGCGRYDWAFEEVGGRVQSLTVTIEAMEILPSGALASVMAWMSSLPYPWCTCRTAVQRSPAAAAVHHVLEVLQEQSA